YKKGGLKALEDIPGIGEGIGKKIIEFLDTGHIKAYEELKKEVPSHINILMNIPRMGPKKVQRLNKVLNISTVEQLEKACKDHKISKLEGFGLKSEQDILEGIYMMRSSKGKIHFKKAEKQANKMIAQLKRLKEVLNISKAGSLRRKKAFIRDIDIIVSSNNPEKVIDTFTKLKEVKTILAKGNKKAMAILKSGTQADLRVFSPDSYGAGLLYFTGSKNYNIELRKVAIKKGYKLNEYGLFNNQTGKKIAGITEKEVLKKLGVKFIKPEEREL
ncbi:MAG: nucleotidyltransferase domain-containing protein, partial [Nanoarchaeota archaeon]